MAARRRRSKSRYLPGKRGGCSKGKRCAMMHIDFSTGRIRPTRGSCPLGDGRRSWCGPTDAMRRYLDALFSIAPEVSLQDVPEIAGCGTEADPLDDILAHIPLVADIIHVLPGVINVRGKDVHTPDSAANQ